MVQSCLQFNKLKFYAVKNLKAKKKKNEWWPDTKCIVFEKIKLHCGSSLRNSQTGSFRKPDMCPVSEAKFRKPVLAGLRSNNEMNLFGFRNNSGLN